MPESTKCPSCQSLYGYPTGTSMMCTSKAIKAGTKVKNIKLTSGDHNIDCKVDGFGAMGLKSIFVRKSS